MAFAVVLATVAALLTPPVASAVINGQLKQLLPSLGGCLTNAPGATGCKAVNAQLGTIGEPAFSPDGRFLYVPTRAGNNLITFERDPVTGVLTERKCIRFNSTAGGCSSENVSPLDDATGVAVSPNGESLYVVGGAAGGGGADGIAHFKLINGIPEYDDCWNVGASSCAGNAVGMANPATVTVSPDNASVYVAGYDSNTIHVFTRSASGRLSQTGYTNAQKCFARVATAQGCTVTPLLLNPRDIEVTPDGKNVIVPNAGYDSSNNPSWGLNLLEFDRDAGGKLVQHPAATGCISAAALFGCKTRDIFWAPQQVTISPDGRRIFVSFNSALIPSLASFLTYQVQEIDRDPATGNLTPNTTWCLRGSESTYGACGTNVVPPVSRIFDIALSPNGTDLYTAGLTNQRVGVFDLAAGGRSATPKPAPFGCVAGAVVADNCGTLLQQGSGNIEYVIPSPDGRNVYAMGDRIYSFAVDHAPECRDTPVPTAFNTAATFKLDCTDADGDEIKFTKLSDPAKGTLGALQTDGTITYGPLVGSTGQDSFTFTATAAGVTADPATAIVDVAAPAGGGGGGGVVVPAGVDNDRDGFFAGQDCNDNNAAIRPGALEIKGNRIDENCDNLAEPFPTLTSGVVHNWGFTKKSPRFTLRVLSITQQLPAGISVTMKCSGSKCPFKSKKLKLPKAKNNTLNVFASLTKKQRKFRAGQTVEVWISAPNFNTKVARIKLKKGKTPVIEPLCVSPGQTQPVKKCD